MSNVEITTLPLCEVDARAFAECASASFERVLERIEAENPDATRALWNAEAYIDTVLTEDKLPISRDYALHLVEVSIVHHVVELAVEADRRAAS